MIDRITAARACAALVAAWMFGLSALAQPASMPLSASASLPRLPQLVQPDAALYPDYYALAQSHTALVDDPQFRPLHLRIAGHQGDPAVIVLPVQTQAFGFWPTFRALVGARLDQELERRHVDASRQTDIVDWRGPFVRRSDDATVAAFAGEHPRSTLLTLYLGHDGDNHAYLSLSRTDTGKVRIAHRQVAIAKTESDTLAALGEALPALLTELGLGDAKPASSLAPAHTEGCHPADWNLADLPSTAAPDEAACHAILMGTLMPDYFSRMGYQAEPTAPDRLAWLARAWVEASSLAPRSPAMQSIAALAWAQLQVDHQARNASGEVESPDVVVRPLARLLWANPRTANLPRDSTARAAADYLRPEIRGLPEFAGALLEARVHYAESFHATDLCPMQLALPHFRMPPGCDEGRSFSTPVRTTPASLSETQLMETWRLAAVWSDLYIEGVERGSRSGVDSVLSNMPTQIAAHPFMQQMRFAVRGAAGQPREAAAHLAWARSAIHDYAQAIVTLQRNDPLIATNKVADAAVSAEQTASEIYPLLDDLGRLAKVTELDSSGSSAWPMPGVATGPAVFLAEGRFADAQQALWRSGGGGLIFATANPSAASAARPTLQPSRPTSVLATLGGTLSSTSANALPSRQSLEEKLSSTPTDIAARMALVLVALEHGEGTAKARQILDARPRSMRAEDALGETDALFALGSLFYFCADLPTAREYFVRAAAFETGSATDMAARARIAIIDGNIAAARQEAHRRAQRYDDDVAVGLEAGYPFMSGRNGEAWPLILGRVQTSTRPDLWRVALAGHRIQGDSLVALPIWVQQTNLDRATNIETGLSGNSWINVYATLDRLPTLPDTDTLKAMSLTDPNQTWARGIQTRRAAIDGAPVPDLEALEEDAKTMWFANQALLPFYAWTVWNATGGEAAPLQYVRDASLESGLWGALAKAMVLAADGRRDESLRFLNVARYELGRNALYGTGYALRDPLRTAPYDFVLATWLMSRKTGEAAYAREGLLVARSYEHVDAFMAWPYAAEALLSKDAKAREIAACRAQKLDAGSMFLRASGLHPDPNGVACRKATVW